MQEQSGREHRQPKSMQVRQDVHTYRTGNHTYQQQNFHPGYTLYKRRYTYQMAVARKVKVEPTYIGFSHTLKGNEVTRSDIKIPK